jgi:hypothetical protein
VGYLLDSYVPAKLLWVGTADLLDLAIFRYMRPFSHYQKSSQVSGGKIDTTRLCVWHLDHW